MKKFAILLLLLAMIPIISLGESVALFPAKGENDLWGYIDRTGEFIIAPQFDAALEFFGNYAQVKVYPIVDGEKDQYDHDCWGLIDRQGNFVLQPCYTINGNDCGDVTGGRETGILGILYPWDEEAEECGKMAFFDMETGFLSPFQWQEIHLWNEKGSPILVWDENEMAGYADPETGEMVIPCQFRDADAFYNGWALASLPYEDGNGEEWVLIGIDGAILHAPEGYFLEQHDSRVSEGLIAVYDENHIASYMNLEGEIILATGYEGTVYPFHEGFAVVNYNQYMDRNGNILEGITARPEENGGYDFKEGLTSVFYQGKPAAMNTDGEIEFVLEEENIFWLWNFMDNGLAWYMEWQMDQGTMWYEQRHYGLIDRQGNDITDGIWICTMEEGSPFSEGLAVVKPMDGQGLYGYLNEQGELALPTVYEEAQPFKNGLAYVVWDGNCGYIDREGAIIYSWSQYGEGDWG
ncbi:MAG: WG repeat-containing protein [Clostridia bacterium]|nr:WG repeat-containing protein [Clostridia bacterium]